MIDIHNHSLFQVDDGSQSLDESLVLLKQAYDQGVTDVVLTPHFVMDDAYHVKREELVEKMKAAAKASNRSLNNFVESILLNVMYCDNPEDVTMASIEEARKQQAAYKNGTLDVKPIDLSNVDNMLKSMGL